MRGTAYYCTVEELQKRGRDDIPEQFRSNTHLIYSSPATLAFNSPGAEGFGVKRAITTVIGGYVSPELDLHHHFIPKEINPADAETCKHLWELYNGSQELCVEMIIKLYKALHSMDMSFCKERRLSRNFS